MNSIVFGERDGEGDRSLLPARKIYCYNMMSGSKGQNSVRACTIMIAGDSILTASQRQYHNKPRPSALSPFSPQRLFHSFHVEPKHRKKRNHVISQMRLRSGFKMRVSILNTATTEQMGYDIVSFFRLFPLNK